MLFLNTLDHTRIYHIAIIYSSCITKSYKSFSSYNKGWREDSYPSSFIGELDIIPFRLKTLVR